MKKLLWIAIIFINAEMPAMAQVVYSEAEIMLQDAYVDALREMNIGRKESAKKKFEALLQKDNKNYAVCFQLSRISEEMDNPEAAMLYGKKAAEGDPENKWYQIYLAGLYAANNKFTEAGVVYRQLVENQPFDENLYYDYAYFLTQSKQYEKALKAYDAIERRVGTEEQVCREKHAIYLALGDNKRAAKELIRLCEAYPESVEFVRLLAGFYSAVGDPGGELSAYRRIAELDRNDTEAAAFLLRFEQQSAPQPGGTSDANFLTALGTMFQNPSMNIDVKVKEVIPYLEQLAQKEDPALGERLLSLGTMLEQTHPKDAKGFAVSADVLVHLGRDAEALEKYKQALLLNKNIYLVYEQAMLSALRLKNYDELLNLSDDCVERFPNQAAGVYLNGMALAAKQRDTDARAAFEQSLMMSSRDKGLQSDIHTAIGQLDLKKNAFEKAKIQFEQAVLLNPSGAALEGLGDALFKLGDTSAAVLKWKEAQKTGNASSEIERKIADKRI